MTSAIGAQHVRSEERATMSIFIGRDNSTDNQKYVKTSSITLRNSPLSSVVLFFILFIPRAFLF